MYRPLCDDNGVMEQIRRGWSLFHIRCANPCKSLRNCNSCNHLIGLSSLLRKTYGDQEPELQTEANCGILAKCDFGRDVVC